VLALASSAGVHAALVPTHAAEAPALGAMFALSTLALTGVALHVDRGPGPVALAAAVPLLARCWPPMPRRGWSSCRRSLTPSRSTPSAPSPSWSKPPG
jgi:hypothetical protein